MRAQPLDVSGEGHGDVFDAYLTPVRDEAGAVVAVAMFGVEVGKRVRAERALRDSEQRYRAFVTASSDVVYRMSPDWSQMRQLDGRGFLADTAEESPDWMDRYILREDRHRVREAIDLAIQSKSMFELEHRVVRADGLPGWTYSRAVPILDEHGEIREWLGAASDVTDRVRAEQVIRQSEERFKVLADNMSQLAWICDSLGNVTWYNQRWLDYTGMTFEDMKGWDWLKVQHPDHLERVVRRVEQSAATGEPWEDTFPLRGRDGQYRWFLSRAIPLRGPEGQIESWFGTNTDVTDQLQADALIRESEQRQAFLLELSDELRPLDEPVKIASVGLHLLRRHLKLDRAYVAEVRGSEQPVVIIAENGRSELAPMPRELRPADFPEGFKKAAEGLLVVDDIWAEASLTELDRKSLDSIALTGFIVAPLHRGVEGMIWALVAGVTSKRAWTRDEGALVADVAERIWNGMERARAEAIVRESEEHQKTLLAELQHRVRNTVGIIRSIARRTGKTSDSVEQMSELLEGRLGAFARVQAAVTRDPTRGVNLRALIDDEIAAVDVPGRHVMTISGPDVQLTPRAAESMSLAIHELATNAVKHGALGTQGGHLDIRWSREAKNRTEWLTLEWIESGLPAKPEPRREGFGHELLRRKLPYDTGGKTQIDIRPDGLCFCITMPLAPVNASAG